MKQVRFLPQPARRARVAAALAAAALAGCAQIPRNNFV